MRTITKESAMIQPNVLAPMPYVPIHYVGKIETPFNMRLNNHRKDAKSEAPISHNFQPHAKLTLTRQIKKTKNFIFR